MDACDAVTFNTRKLAIKCVSDAAGRDTYRILQNHPVNNEKKVQAAVLESLTFMPHTLSFSKSKLLPSHLNVNKHLTFGVDKSTTIDNKRIETCK